MRLSKYYRSFLRIRLNKRNRKRLKNRNFSVISSNCVGDVLLHELNQRFCSPTVNLFFSAQDYIRFLNNLDYYLSCDLKQAVSKEHYPVGLLDDIYIHFVHYDNFETAKNKWEQRSKRINRDNLFIIMVQRDGCTDRLVEEFSLLPYQNKVIFTARERKDIECAYYIENSEEKGEVMDLCLYKHKFTGRRWIDDFDFVNFFNGGNSIADNT